MIDQCIVPRKPAGACSSFIGVSRTVDVESEEDDIFACGCGNSKEVTHLIKKKKGTCAGAIDNRTVAILRRNGLRRCISLGD